MSDALAGSIQVFRRFNRNYTRFLGTLSDRYLASDFSLTEGRVLYELANRQSPNASDISEELGIDKGYLSRILRKFERAGLLRKRMASDDARRTQLELTKRGRAAFDNLNRLSDEQARSALESAGPEAQLALIRSMQSIESIVLKNDHRIRPHLLRPHRIGDMGWIVQRESIGYAQQYGWNASFEMFLLKLTADFLENFDSARERCWIGEIDGQNMGHVFLMKDRHDPSIARLRLLFVEPAARGQGLGEALVAECIRFARTAGYRKLVLLTQSILKAAHRIYERAGFRLIKEEPHRSWGQELVGQEWELELK